MFLETSRYFTIKQVEGKAGNGRSVKAVSLRRLPEVTGVPTGIKDNDRLDIIANHQYTSPTMFWHIADANSELEANRLLKDKGRVVNVPEI